MCSGRLLVALGAALSLAACMTVGPDYKVPKDALVKAPFANGPIDGTDGKIATRQPVPENWWHLYNDPVLNGLIEQALRSNTDLRVAAANLARSRAEVGFAQAQGGLSGGTSTQEVRGRLSGEQYLKNEGVPVSTIVDTGIAVSYQIDLFGVLRRGVEAAKADDDAVQAASDLARITVVADVVRAYVQSCAAGDELSIAKRTLEIQKERADATRRLRDAGRESTPDVTRDETEVRNARAAIPRFIGEKRVAAYRLAALLAESPSDLPKQVYECEHTPGIDQPIPVGDGAALLKRRPDVREAERNLAAATARIGVAMGALYPTVTIGASAGLTGLAGDLGSPQTQRYGYGPLISWTFPVNGETEKIKAARAESDAQLARFDGVVLNALRETESSLAANQADSDTVEALTSAQMSATQAAQQVHSLYLGGRTSFISDLDATHSLVSADGRLAAARTQLALDQVSLFLALGGGWDSTHAVSSVSGDVGGM